MNKITILVVSANPAGTSPLNLDEEVRQIEAKVRATEYRDSIEIITKWAVRPDDLLQCLNQFKPTIVHFSGHGSPTEEIILLDEQRRPKKVAKATLVELFRILKKSIRVVVLNSCFSEPQAAAIASEIECTIGMGREIGDDAAIIFAAAFYRAIGFGQSVKNAFDQGRVALQLEGVCQEDIPVLMTKAGIFADDVTLINPH
jgi:hypothetical protein